MTSPYLDPCPLTDYYQGKELNKPDCTCSDENSCKSAKFPKQFITAHFEPLKALIGEQFGEEGKKMQQFKLSDANIPKFLLKHAIVTDAHVKMPYKLRSTVKYEDYIKKRLS